MVPLGTTSTLFLFSQHTTAVDIHPETAPFSASFLCAGNKADKLREKRGCRKAPSCDMGKNHRSHRTRRPHHCITSMPVTGRRACSKRAIRSVSNTCVEISTHHQHLRTHLPPAQPPSRRSSPQSSTFRPLSCPPDTAHRQVTVSSPPSPSSTHPISAIPAPCRRPATQHT